MLKRILNLFRQPGKNVEPEPGKTSTTVNVPWLTPDTVEKALESLHRALEKISSEPDYVSAEAKTGAIQLLDQAKQESSQWEKEWQRLNSQPEPPQEALRALHLQLSATERSLFILVKRGLVRRRLNIVAAQLAQQQSALPQETLQSLIQPHLAQEQEKVQALEKEAPLDSAQQKLLAIYRGNVELYQQMLAGERPYAPLYLLNEVSAQERELKDIDHQLTLG
jgi:hypothetical protein